MYKITYKKSQPIADSEFDRWLQEYLSTVQTVKNYTLKAEESFLNILTKYSAF